MYNNFFPFKFSLHSSGLITTKIQLVAPPKITKDWLEILARFLIWLQTVVLMKAICFLQL